MMNTETTEVTLENAMKWTKLWQKNNDGKHCKAFLMPAQDVTAILKEMNILVKNKVSGKFELDETKLPNAGLRNYVGIDVTKGTGKENGYGEKLVIVGTEYDSETEKHKDIILNPTDPTSEKSGVYDFTAPCPNDCDTSSELYHG